MSQAADIHLLPNDKKMRVKKKREFDFSRHPKRRIALLFMYFGWEYNGLVEQQEITRTVEEEMRKALIKTKLVENWENCSWNRSGRTDKGVSAFRQVASVIVRNNSTLKLNEEATRYEFLQFTVKGSGFLWHQIRCIMALLCEIGQGNEKPEIIAELLDIRLTPAKPIYGLAPAFPLCLFDCVYDGMELSWRWDINSLKSIRKLILKTWAHYQSLSATLQIMAETIGLIAPVIQDDYSGLNEYLRPSGSSTETYIPIKKRPTCDALELKREKIRAKMSKIIADFTSNSDILSR
ncbi:tRNA pseudouridine synthase A [Onchocerca flexuosa]|uniref:tRNA pseudouridine synthase n=1 Tax=Onchocerca flexuosa TaxID=387005 RepID=A0A238BXL8_9BILA|nr:tRNA pseudouridine synthase A [Onchocerca flexuosa]